MPPKFTELRIQGIESAVIAPVCLTDHEQANLGIGVVDEGMGHSRSGWEGGRIARLQRMQVTVDPDLRPTGENEDQLLAVAVGMWR